MNKRILQKAQKFGISTDRLYDNREQYPVEWLLRGNECGSFGSYGNNLNRIKSAILCMNKNHPNYESLSEDDKAKVEKLIQHEDIVNIVLLTTFQWFGTNVGKCDIGKLLDEIRKLKYEEIIDKEK